MFISTTIIRLISVVETSQKKEVKSASHKDAKIQSYSLDFKLSVIEHAEEHGNSATAKKLVLLGKRVREWRKSKEEIILNLLNASVALI